MTETDVRYEIFPNLYLLPIKQANMLIGGWMMWIS